MIYVFLLSFFVSLSNICAEDGEEFFLKDENLSQCIGLTRKKEFDKKQYINCVNSINSAKDFSFLDENICSSLSKEVQDYAHLCICKKKFYDKDIHAAISNCRKAIEINPLNDGAYMELGRIYYSINQNENALENLKMAIEINEKNQRALFWLSREYEKEKKYKQAISGYKKLLAGIDKKDMSYLKKSDYLKNRIKKIEYEMKTPDKKDANSFKHCVEEYKNIEESKLEDRFSKGAICLKYGFSDYFLLDYSKLLKEMGKYEKAISKLNFLINKSKDKKSLIEAQQLLADLYLKMGDSDKALSSLKSAYNLGLENEYWLNEYSNLLEEYGRYHEALKVLERIKNPQSEIVQKKEYLKDKTMTDKDILDNLISRDAVNPNKTELSPEDKELFLTIRLVERKGAVEYIKKKYMGYAGLWLDKMEGREIRSFLTFKGFNLYLRELSQKAVRFYEKNGIALNEVFNLKTLSGNPIFDKRGLLTSEGISSYFSYEESGEKNYLRAYETPVEKPKKEEKEERNEEIKKLLSMGYMEIEENEYLWLKSATECPDEVLLNPPCNLKAVKFKKRIRYFICYREGLCTDTSLKLAAYIGGYRNGSGENMTGKSEKPTTSFFGSPTPPKRKFCYQNKIWNGVD